MTWDLPRTTFKERIKEAGQITLPQEVMRNGTRASDFLSGRKVPGIAGMIGSTLIIAFALLAFVPPVSQARYLRH